MSESSLIGRTHWSDPLAADYLALRFAGLSINDNLIVVCVGTDRSTGDCLGPLVGSQLLRKKESGVLHKNVEIHGTLDDPIHALNINEHVERLNKEIPTDTTVLAIDACLGRAQNVGTISLKHGALKPGTGVNKRLPSVGDYHLIGIVNVSGFMEHAVLQNTRLSLVFQMAEIITDGLTTALSTQRTALLKHSVLESAYAYPSN